MDNSWWGPIGEVAAEGPGSQVVHRSQRLSTREHRDTDDLSWCGRAGCACGPPSRSISRSQSYPDESAGEANSEIPWVGSERGGSGFSRYRDESYESASVMRLRDALRFERVISEKQRPWHCGVHWSHFRNGKLIYAQPHPAVALWNGRWYLCESALDDWLDDADEDPSLEPERLMFL